MRELPIGIFDSGLGGLTVVREIMNALPDEGIVYFGDTLRCPYGPRQPREVRTFVLEIGQWLMSQHVKMIVIACNTASAAALDLAEAAFPVPVIGVIEPGAVAAVKATKNQRVGVIGTAGTIASGAYSRAVRALDERVTVFSAATPRFVEVVEQGLRLGSDALEDWLSGMGSVFIRPSFYEMARDYLSPLKQAGIDTLILGCTHFPLLATPIQQVMGMNVRLVSSAEETAREVARVLDRLDARAPHESKRIERFATSGDAEEFRCLGARVLRRPVGPAEHVSVPELESALNEELRRVLEKEEEVGT